MVRELVHWYEGEMHRMIHGAAGWGQQTTRGGIGAVDFPKLRPLFVDATDKAVKKLMDNFNNKTRKM